MRNKVTIGQQTYGQPLAELEPGTMFRCQEPSADDTVYMKTDGGKPPFGMILCILLANGVSYSYSREKQVIPMRRGQSVMITQGG